MMVVFMWMQLGSHLRVSVRRLSTIMTHHVGAESGVTVKCSQYNE